MAKISQNATYVNSRLWCRQENTRRLKLSFNIVRATQYLMQYYFTDEGYNNLWNTNIFNDYLMELFLVQSYTVQRTSMLVFVV